MIDTTCLKWKESKCGSKQSCLVYDPELLSWTIMGVGNCFLENLQCYKFHIFLAVVCKLVSILATIIGYMTYRPNDLDSAVSVQTTDSRGPLSLTVNDDRQPAEIARQSLKKGSAATNHIAFPKPQENNIKDNISDEITAGSPTRL